jgi:hypothetical protein
VTSKTSTCMCSSRVLRACDVIWSPGYGGDRVTLEGVAHVTPIRNTDPNYGCNWLLIHQPAGLKSPQVFFPEHRFRSEHRFRCRGNLTGKKKKHERGHRNLGHVRDATGACVAAHTVCLYIISLATPDRSAVVDVTSRSLERVPQPAPMLHAIHTWHFTHI